MLFFFVLTVYLLSRWIFPWWISLKKIWENRIINYIEFSDLIITFHGKIIFSPRLDQPINFQPPFCWRTQEVYKKNESVLSIQILRSLFSSYSKILERILLTEKKRLTRCTTFDIPFRTNYPAHKFDPNLYFIPLGNISQCFLSTYLAN